MKHSKRPCLYFLLYSALPFQFMFVILILMWRKSNSRFAKQMLWHSLQVSVLLQTDCMRPRVASQVSNIDLSTASASTRIQMISAGLNLEGHWWVVSWVGEICQLDPLPPSAVTHYYDCTPPNHLGLLLHLEPAEGSCSSVSSFCWVAEGRTGMIKSISEWRIMMQH